jgi:hypothetical protein
MVKVEQVRMQTAGDYNRSPPARRWLDKPFLYGGFPVVPTYVCMGMHVRGSAVGNPR